MSANIIDGKEFAGGLREKIAQSVKDLRDNHNTVSYTHLTLPTTPYV